MISTTSGASSTPSHASPQRANDEETPATGEFKLPVEEKHDRWFALGDVRLPTEYFYRLIESARSTQAQPATSTTEG